MSFKCYFPVQTTPLAKVKCFSCRSTFTQIVKKEFFEDGQRTTCPDCGTEMKLVHNEGQSV